MVLRLRIGGRNQRDSGWRPRRPLIYPHRAVRYIAGERIRLAAGVSMAALLTLLVALSAGRLMQWHATLAGGVLNMAGIPAASWQPVTVYDSIGAAPAPDTFVPTFNQLSTAPRLLLVLAVAALMLASRRWTLARSLIGFVIVLLLTSALLNSLYPDFTVSAAAFTRIWFKFEAIVWLILPWASALLFIVFQPGVAAGAVLVVLAQVYGFLFGVLRYSFFLGMLHHTGLLFFPALWLALGLLANLLFLLVFYSLAVHQASGRLWGERRAWD